MKKVLNFLWFSSFLVLILPAIALAQSSGGGGGINSPISATSIPEVLDAIIDFLLIVAFPISVLMAIWVGFLFMTAGSNESKITMGKKTLFYLIIGVGILVLSKGIINTVINLF